MKTTARPTPPKRFVATASHILLALACTLALTWSAHAAPGDVDLGFDPSADFQVYTTAVQPDGKIVVGGLFGTIGGGVRNAIARLNSDGTLDADFNLETNGGVYDTAVLADGKIIIAGGFSDVGGMARNGIARFNADGTVDTGFDPNVNARIYGMAVQPDGKIVIAGDFTEVGGVAQSYVARLNTDGTLDPGFHHPDLALWAYGVAVQDDGKIVIVGVFDAVDGVGRSYIARLNADGTLDPGFDPHSYGAPRCVAVQADGKIIIGGKFFSLRPNGATMETTRNHVARLNPDGSLDTGFNPDVSTTDDEIVLSAVLQADGKIIIGGSYTTVGGVGRNNIVRLNPDGTVDTAFNPDANNAVTSTALQGDGKILLGGTYTTLGGVTRNRIARLDNDPAIQSLTVPSTSRVQWLRGGALPETLQVTFELSTNSGATYTPLGAGFRIAGGWEVTSLSLPASGQIRARARTTGSYFNGSSGLVEQTAAFGVAPLVITGAATDITPTSATLNGSVNPNESTANALFEWGTDTNYGNTTTAQNVGSGNVAVPFSTALTGLAARTTYHFRAVATNSAGTSTGGDAMFTTGDSNPVPGADVMLIVMNPTHTINPLTNDTDPDGDALTVTGATNGAKGTVGFTGNSVTYTAATLGTGTDTFHYTVSDGFGGAAQGTVKVFSLGSQAGFYAGFIDGANGVDGASQITMSSSGKLTGRIYFHGLKYSFKGQLLDDGTATIQISRSNQAVVILHLTLLPGDAPTFMVSIEQQGTTTGTGTADRSGAQVPGKGHYTLLLPPDPAQTGAGYPQGTGYATVNISAKGKISIAGAMGDGAKFSTASALRTDNTFPFFAPIYRAPRGEIYGTLTLREVPGVSDIDGPLTWIKPKQINVTPQQPNGFSTSTVVVGSHYVKPAAINGMLTYNATGDATLAFHAGNLAAPLMATIHVGPLNPPSVAPPVLDMTFTITNGRFTGDFTRPGAGKTKFQGAVLPKQNRGAGFFLGNTQSGTVDLTPSP